ncbi:MAG TPA: TlpA disulfide reductase family protein [Phycisphaerales bacterium]|nr:TlpA disulfide reductase family protein [Phycisphaerales bacterium]
MLCAMLLSCCALADPVPLTFVPSGASEKSGRFLTARAEAAPSDAMPGVQGALAGSLAMDGGVAFVMGTRDGTPVLIVDTNRNADLRDDAPAVLATSKYGAEKQFTRWDGSFVVMVGGSELSCRWFRFDPADPQRANLAKTLHYYRDYGREGTLELGSKSYRVMVMDDRTLGSFDPARPNALVNLYLDRNANGTFESKGEIYDVSEPFNIGGTTWEVRDLAADGASLRVVESDTRVEEVHPPLDHRVGGTATPFEGTSAEGTRVKFPDDFRGKLVLLDFWATWCQPCLIEMPNVVRAKKDFGARGFTVLGVSLDAKNAEKKMESTATRLGMDWPSVYDGGHWSARVAKLYEIASIPAAYLVDGDTGKVLAVGEQARGANLAATIERELKARGR